MLGDDSQDEGRLTTSLLNSDDEPIPVLGTMEGEENAAQETGDKWRSRKRIGIAALILAIIGSVVALCWPEKDMFILDLEKTYGNDHLAWPFIPLWNIDPFFQTFILSTSPYTDDVRGWFDRKREMKGMVRIDGKVYRFLSSCSNVIGTSFKSGCPPEMQVQSIHVGTMRTEIVYSDGGVRLVVNFVNTVNASDVLVMSRPVFYLTHQLYSEDGKNHSVQLYFDLSSEHATFKNEPVSVNRWTKESQKVHGLRVGTQDQPVLHSSGDQHHLNWGYLYLGTDLSNKAFGGPASKSRDSFRATGSLPSSDELDKIGVLNSTELVVLSTVASVRVGPSSPANHTVTLGYDDIESVSYYGHAFKGLWTEGYNQSSFQELLTTAHNESWGNLFAAIEHEEKQDSALRQGGGVQYAALGRMAYRMAMGAVKVVWNHIENKPWAFLKEISTNGDMNTVDVVFPASPAYLYYNPDLLVMLLEPVLYYAENKTSTPYRNPYSPHEIGVYPIADHTTEQQEPMPMENTGNMFLMICGILQRSKDALPWVSSHFELLRTWADYLVETLPFPGEQLCTDDFNGKLANSTLLSSKGIVALQAFAEICARVGTQPAGTCSSYADKAKEYAQVWMERAVKNTSMPHSTLVFSDPVDTWSIKYNLAWQVFLQLDGPFPKHLFADEISFYIASMNKFGTPLDSRNANTKLDWLSWVACLGNQSQFDTLMTGIYRAINETSTHQPLMDLYDTVKATNSYEPNKGFRNRPVLGAIFGRMLYIEKNALKP